MVQQVNIAGIGVSQRHQQLVTANITLDRFDTGKVLVVSSSAAILAVAGLTCSLPSASAVESGFFCTILLASNHSHSVQRVDQTTDTVAGQAGTGLGGGAPPAEQPLAVGTHSGVQAHSGEALRTSSVGAKLEIFCDGVTWYLDGPGGGDWDPLT
jgi:hypothetical protein